ncbi:MAG: hypothetical protein EB078_05625 [Proteobacteria bacterium]|nr:hypothetical protein [Pseudomonadota bacterium]NDC24402.1 hypothetical protein [Pseudomonadota bacterium]NDD04364.1 hypothetical protein [Pseudomonadota bacterium]NDG27689.1 hypothetical protein [Pseudomonadota bacterium]
MGFYLELVPQENNTREFRELPPPSSFWVLYLVGIFALSCMGAAAYAVLGGLFSQASLLDGIILGTIAGFLLLFAAVGFKMLALRKFIRWPENRLQVGFLIFGQPWILKSFVRREIETVEVVNHKPAPNRAPDFHDDPQYFVKGHWRLILVLKNKKTFVLDKHVEREAIQPLYNLVSSWFAARE